jgi:putative solute:sodium symporter small subunit
MPTEPRSQPAAAASARRQAPLARAAHWHATRRLTYVLMVLWLCTCFGTIYFARELSHLTLFGWPLSFYMAAQGASLVSLAVIAFYAWRMRRLDRRYAAPCNAQAGEDA